jgi:hypothetical protein
MGGEVSEHSLGKSTAVHCDEDFHAATPTVYQWQRRRASLRPAGLTGLSKIKPAPISRKCGFAPFLDPHRAFRQPNGGAPQAIAF